MIQAYYTQEEAPPKKTRLWNIVTHGKHVSFVLLERGALVKSLLLLLLLFSAGREGKNQTSADSSNRSVFMYNFVLEYSSRFSDLCTFMSFVYSSYGLGQQF